MLQKRDQVPMERNAGVTQPRSSRGLIQNLSRRKLQSAMIADVMRNHELRTIRGPVGVLNIVKQLAGCAAGERHDCQRASTADHAKSWVEQDSHLSFRRDGQNVGVHAKSPGLEI